MRNQMGPAEFPDHCDLNTTATRREINGPRPPLLKIHKDSRLIKKASSHRYPSSSSSSSNNSSSSCSSSLSNPNHFPDDSSQQQPRRPQPKGTSPVIIYIHSPKVIHTKARDFMALVQKLTGFSRPHHHDNGEPAPAPDPPQLPQPQKAPTEDNIALDEWDVSSSVLSEDRRNGAVPAIHEADCISPILSHQNALISDIPLFTPNAADFFLSPGQRMYRYPYSAYMSPSAAHRIVSPSISEFMKEMPEC